MLHRALHTGCFHVIVDPKRVVDQEKDPRNNIFHQGLSPKTDGKTYDTGTGDQGADVDPQGR